MASDYLLEIDGIPGESNDSEHKNTIELDSFSWGVHHPGGFADGTKGGATGQSSFADLNVTTHVNKASPNIEKACATGQHIKKVTLWVRKATGKPGQKDYYIIKLEECLVSSYQAGGGGSGGAVSESFSINYAKIDHDYKPQKPDGALDAAVNFKYDLTSRKA